VIHPSAIVDPQASVHESCSIGPFAVIGADVVIGAGNTIGPHTVITGPTTIGKDNHIFQFASIGADPQDLKFDGSDSRLEIGSRNKIREFVTVNRGTTGGGGLTRIGSLVHQFSRVGEHSFSGMGSVINKDVPPYVLVSGHFAESKGINKEGMKRRGFSAEEIRAIQQSYVKLVRRKGVIEDGVFAEVEQLG